MSNCPLKTGEMQWNAEVPTVCKIRCVNKALLFATPVDMTQPTTHEEIAAEYGYPKGDILSIEGMEGGVNTGIQRIDGCNVRKVIEEVGKDPGDMGENEKHIVTNRTETDIICTYDGAPQN